MSQFEAPLGEVCDVKRGTTITQRQTRPGTVPVIAGGLEPAYFHDTANRDGNVISISSSGANAGFVNFWENPIFASDCSTVASHRKDIDIRFIYYFLRARQDEINSLRCGAAQPHVYAKDIAKLRICVPPIKEQKRIVDVLSRAEGIVGLRRNAQARAAVFIQSLFADLFRDYKDFEVNLLQDLIDKQRGISYGVVQRGEHFPGGVPLLRISDFGGNLVAPRDIVSVDPAISQQYRRTILNGGEIVVSIRGTVGRVAIVPDSSRGWNVAREVAVVPLLPNISRAYVHTYMLTPAAQSFMMSEVRGIAQKGINLEDLRRLPVPMPPRQLLLHFEAHAAAFQSVLRQQSAALSVAERVVASLLANSFGRAENPARVALEEAAVA